MNYAEQLRDNYFENKERIAKQRVRQHLTRALTLENKLRGGYGAYVRFCRDTGCTPKKIGQFLRTKVI